MVAVEQRSRINKDLGINRAKCPKAHAQLNLPRGADLYKILASDQVKDGMVIKVVRENVYLSYWQVVNQKGVKALYQIW